MSIKVKLVACLSALAPWLLAMPASADETLCSQANPTPPPCIPSTIIPLPDGQTLRHYDSSFVDPTIHTYVLAALGTVAAGTGPSSNRGSSSSTQLQTKSSTSSMQIRRSPAAARFLQFLQATTPSPAQMGSYSLRERLRDTTQRGISGLETVRSIPRVVPTPGTQATANPTID